MEQRTSEYLIPNLWYKEALLSSLKTKYYLKVAWLVPCIPTSTILASVVLTMAGVERIVGLSGWGLVSWSASFEMADGRLSVLLFLLLVMLISLWELLTLKLFDTELPLYCKKHRSVLLLKCSHIIYACPFLLADHLLSNEARDIERTVSKLNQWWLLSWIPCNDLITHTGVNQILAYILKGAVLNNTLSAAQAANKGWGKLMSFDQQPWSFTQTIISVIHENHWRCDWH